jgi:hypothetical protein
VEGNWLGEPLHPRREESTTDRYIAFVAADDCAAMINDGTSNLGEVNGAASIAQSHNGEK